MNNLKLQKKVIGMIHLLPTIGFKGFSNIEDILKRALEDLIVLEKGGVDQIIIENNYDLPHDIKLKTETIVLIGYILGKLKKHANVPIGLSMLWNDYKTALSLAKIYECFCVRVPVFVDSVKTDFGEIYAQPQKIIDYRRKIGAENVKLFTDIQVKHAEILFSRSIVKSALDAIKNGSDGIIITGKWTGDAPNLNELKSVKEVLKKIPLIIGSGTNIDNIGDLLIYADQVIVSTSLKEGEDNLSERNIKPYYAKIDFEKTRNFVNKFKLNVY